MNDGYQTLAFNLFEPWGVWGAERFALSTRGIVKDADHLAAAIERRYLFDDDSGDCEAPDASSLFKEADSDDKSVARMCFSLIRYGDAWNLERAIKVLGTIIPSANSDLH
jgi:hypothetical protein